MSINLRPPVAERDEGGLDILPYSAPFPTHTFIAVQAPP